MSYVSEPLRLPEGYKIEATAENNLMLKRPDGSPVVVFEFSAFGPEPSNIMQIAWDDAEWVQQDAGRGSGV